MTPESFAAAVGTFVLAICSAKTRGMRPSRDCSCDNVAASSDLPVMNFRFWPRR